MSNISGDLDELKQQCSRLGLRTTGMKATLKSRIEEYYYLKSLENSESAMNITVMFKNTAYKIKSSNVDIYDFKRLVYKYTNCLPANQCLSLLNTNYKHKLVDGNLLSNNVYDDCYIELVELCSF